ncbi:MAG: VOC family protein [Acidobacteria bacterium]|nr:VOC family protein [Acidobacteriota bacterium]
MNVSEIRSATVSCSDLEASLRFWRDLIGFEEVWRCSIGGSEVERAWGVPARTRAAVAFLRYDGIETGQLRLVQFTPYQTTHVRARTDSAWAIGVVALDCNVRDPEKTFALLREAGYESESAQPLYYVVDGLQQSEVLFYTPDDVRLVLVGAMNYSPDMARPGVSGHFGALTTISQFVADMDASVRFYREGLGLEQVFDAWIDDATRPIVNKMAGIPEHAELRLAAHRRPGEPDGKHLLLQTRGVPVVSIAEKMQPPNLGIVMLSHATDDLNGLRARILEYGGQLVTEPGAIAVGGHRTACSFLARAPQGVLLEFYQEE